jgi:hypothetical protein
MSEPQPGAGFDAPVLDPRILGLSVEQVRVAGIIEEEFRAAGFGGAVAAAAIVNAYRESSLNPKEESETKRYIGLFQVSPDILPSVADRKNPRKNTRAIIGEALKRRDFLDFAGEESDIGLLAEAFCVMVERPKNKTFEGELRRSLTGQLYPTSYWENAPEALPPRAPPYQRPPFLGLNEREQVVAAWMAVLVVIGVGTWHLRGAKRRLATLDANDLD